MEVMLVLVVVIAVALVLRLVAGGIDDDRVRQYVESRGGRVLEKHWSPFGTGWLGEKNARIYELRYIDAEGNEHEATCKTSMWSGVYMTEDRIVRRAPTGGRPISLEEENRRLREELQRLRGR